MATNTYLVKIPVVVDTRVWADAYGLTMAEVATDVAAHLQEVATEALRAQLDLMGVGASVKEVQ